MRPGHEGSGSGSSSAVWQCEAGGIRTVWAARAQCRKCGAERNCGPGSTKLAQFWPTPAQSGGVDGGDGQAAGKRGKPKAKANAQASMDVPKEAQAAAKSMRQLHRELLDSALALGPDSRLAQEARAASEAAMLEKEVEAPVSVPDAQKRLAVATEDAVALQADIVPRVEQIKLDLPKLHELRDRRIQA